MAQAGLPGTKTAALSAGPACLSDSEGAGDDLRALEYDECRVMYDAAADAVECMAAMAARGRNPVTEVLDGVDAVEEWAHFPAGDIVDPVTHSQFYYHAHAAAERASGEHGHFHTFVRPKLLCPDRSPMAIAESAESLPDTTWVAHLVGISTDERGHPIRLFTTNRWVTDEVWYDAETVIAMLDSFDITVEQPSVDLNRWVSAMVQLFRPQIAILLRKRDAVIAQWRIEHSECDVFEDRELQIVSETPIDFLNQIRAVETALNGSRQN
ncbi:MAG: hypothetical protein GC182_16370 [Rhodopseudomonas sp.]|nr:hypothetical protein [Rhodopseudomonas sp.]